MDKATVKLLLQSYRPQDANEPIFQEALREVAADPELAAWFEEMQRLDAIIIGKLQNLPVSADVKRHILLGYPEGGHASKIVHVHPRRWVMVGSLAALILVGLFVWETNSHQPGKINPLALQAINYTDNMPALQFVCFKASAVASWINRQPDCQKMGFQLPPPDASMSMKMIGGSVVQWNGHPVIMVCLQNGQRMAMLYIMNASDAPEIKQGAPQTFQKADWVVRATRTDNQVRLLAAKGEPQDLNFQMPF